MYGPPPDCKKNRCNEKQSAKMYPASVENGLRAHDDDPRVPVLDNRRGRERPCYVTGFQARRLTVFSSPIPLQTSEKRILKNHFV
jgi:hypothetical protein